MALGLMFVLFSLLVFLSSFHSFKIASHSVVQQSSLELVGILLTEPSNGRDYRGEPPCLAISFCFRS